MKNFLVEFGNVRFPLGNEILDVLFLDIRETNVVGEYRRRDVWINVLHHD